MDIRKIKTLIEMLESSNLNEIEVSQGDESVRISKGNDKVGIERINQKQVTDNKINEVKWDERSLTKHSIIK